MNDCGERDSIDHPQLAVIRCVGTDTALTPRHDQAAKPLTSHTRHGDNQAGNTRRQTNPLSLTDPEQLPVVLTR